MVAIALALLLAGPWAAGAQTEIVYTVSPDDAVLRTIDPATAATLTSIPITLAGTTVLGGTGLARHPTTGALWALLTTTTTPAGTRELVTVDPMTGVATLIGNTGGAFAGLAFNGPVLYGVTGDELPPSAAVPSESLFTLSTSDASATLVCNLGRGFVGEALGFNTDDDLLYHASGVIDTVFETFDGTIVGPLCIVTDIPIPPALQAKAVQALGFRPSMLTFFWSQGIVMADSALYDVTPAGVATLVGPLDHVAKGIAVALVPPALDHFTCYNVLATASLTPQTVTLEDQFREAQFTAGKALTLCNPTDKNGENPGAETHPDHLTTYSIAQSFPPKFPGVNGLVVTDQFGTLFLDAVTPNGVLVPTAKSLIEPPPPPDPEVDHFVCYTVKTTAGKPPFVRVNDVTIKDQFGTRTVDLSKPSRLCNPANKNGENPGAETHINHLMCYQAQGATPAFSAVSPIYVNNQYGAQQFKATTLVEVCVPALKELPTPP
jgi:hypothetical protein